MVVSNSLTIAGPSSGALPIAIRDMIGVIRQPNSGPNHTRRVALN